MNEFSVSVPSLLLNEDPEFEKLILEDVTNYYTQFMLAVRLGIKVKHIYPLIFNIKGRLTSEKQLSNIGVMGKDFDGVVRLRSILEDARLRGVEFIELPKKVSLSFMSDKLVHLDSYLKPSELNSYGKRLLDVKEKEHSFVVTSQGS